MVNSLRVLRTNILHFPTAFCSFRQRASTQRRLAPAPAKSTLETCQAQHNALRGYRLLRCDQVVFRYENLYTRGRYHNSPLLLCTQSLTVGNFPPLTPSAVPFPKFSTSSSPNLLSRVD